MVKILSLTILLAGALSMFAVEAAAAAGGTPLPVGARSPPRVNTSSRATAPVRGSRSMPAT